MKKSLLIFVMGLIYTLTQTASAQSPDNNYNAGGGVYSIATQGNSVITACVQAGQFIRFNVVCGESYSFSTCGASWDTEMTLWSIVNGSSVLAFDDDDCGTSGGPSFITWTATLTGTIRVLLDAKESMQNKAACSTITLAWLTSSSFGNNVYPNVEVLSVYPNPSENNFKVSINSTQELQLVYLITDLNGRDRLTQYAHLNEGANTVQLQTADLPVGLYLLVVQKQDGTHVHTEQISRN
ncbi:MAG: T9SS type A sorting domain-containing protein [Flavobacteriales bacterium]|nr:T9SS type A sorting domain-containing protein [Flavobacteriales bacterium]